MTYRTAHEQAHMRSRMESATPSEFDAAWGDGAAADEEPEELEESEEDECK